MCARTHTCEYACERKTVREREEERKCEREREGIPKMLKVLVIPTELLRPVSIGALDVLESR